MMGLAGLLGTVELKSRWSGRIRPVVTPEWGALRVVARDELSLATSLEAVVALLRWCCPRREEADMAPDQNVSRRIAAAIREVDAIPFAL